MCNVHLVSSLSSPTNSLRRHVIEVNDHITFVKIKLHTDTHTQTCTLRTHTGFARVQIIVHLRLTSRNLMGHINSSCAILFGTSYNSI